MRNRGKNAGGPSKEHFGERLKRAREARGLTLGDVSRVTKIKETALLALENGQTGSPAPVFLRGFVGAYARAVGMNAADALGLLDERLRPEPEPIFVEEPEADALATPGVDSRRRFGVALVVLLILVVATLTLSLLLRHGNRAGGPISRWAPRSGTSVETRVERA